MKCLQLVFREDLMSAFWDYFEKALPALLVVVHKDKHFARRKQEKNTQSISQCWRSSDLRLYFSNHLAKSWIPKIYLCRITINESFHWEKWLNIVITKRHSTHENWEIHYLNKWSRCYEWEILAVFIKAYPSSHTQVMPVMLKGYTVQEMLCWG